MSGVSLITPITEGGNSKKPKTKIRHCSIYIYCNSLRFHRKKGAKSKWGGWGGGGGKSSLALITGDKAKK